MVHGSHVQDRRRTLVVGERRARQVRVPLGGSGVLTYEVGSATNVGRVRSTNEDSLLVQDGLFVVADGMGGHAAGEVASKLAVDLLAAAVPRDNATADDVRHAVARASGVIAERGRAHAQNAGMGTTVTGLCVVSVGGSPHWAVFNVGDSRVYRFADDALEQVTLDHSHVQELVDTGRISAADARVHPLRNVVTRSLGTDSPPEADVWLLPLVSAETFLLCSDGLYDELDDQQIADLLRTEPDSQGAANRLVEKAVAAGGRDNVTVVVVRTRGDLTDETTTPRDGPPATPDQPPH